MFLMGPGAQLKRMFDKGRWVATAIYLASMLLTLLAAYVVRYEQWQAARMYPTHKPPGSVWAVGLGVSGISVGSVDMVQPVVHTVCTTSTERHPGLGCR